MPQLAVVKEGMAFAHITLALISLHFGIDISNYSPLLCNTKL